MSPTDVSHQDSVQARVGLLEPRAAFSFALCCCERLLLVYSRAASGSNWDRSSLLREGLDRSWACVLGSGSGLVDRALSEACRASIPAEPDSAAAVAAFVVGNEISDFLLAMARNDPGNSWTPAARCIDIIDMADDEGAPEAAIRDLMTLEIERQNAELDAVSEPIAAAGLERMIRVAQASPLLGSWWFDASPDEGRRGSGR